MFGVIVTLILIALIPAFIAKGKGRSFLLWYGYGLFLFLFAFIHALIIKPNEYARGMKKCPKCASIISESAVICPSCRTEFSSEDGDYQQAINRSGAGALYKEYDGEADIKSSAYQLYLTRRYGIEKNNTLDKYTIANDVFDSLEKSLAVADRLYKLAISEEKEAAIIREQKKIADEKEKQEYAVKAAREAELQMQRFTEEEARLAPLRAAKRRKIMLAMAIVSPLIIGGVIYAINDHQTKSAELKAKVESEESRLRAAPTPPSAIQSAKTNRCDYNGKSEYLYRIKGDLKSAVYKIGCYNDDRYVICSSADVCYYYGQSKPND